MDNFNFVLAAIPILVGLVIIGLVLNLNMKAKKAAKNWLTAPGVIISSDLDLQSSRGTGVPTQYFKPIVSYSYQVGAQSYQGERLDFASRAYRSETKAKQRIAAFQQGAQVTVHYDPVDPSKAVLEPTAAGNGLLIILGIALILTGVFFVL